jgi:hypothetical protein
MALLMQVRQISRSEGNDADELNNNYRDPSKTFVQKGDFLCIRDIHYSMMSKRSFEEI